MSKPNGLPRGWTTIPLSAAVAINPPKGTLELDGATSVHFVPMASVRAEFGGIDVSTVRALHEVANGYKAFREGDVLFAKITPCMENGKLAVVPNLKFDVGFGSTEFHVLRPTGLALSNWIALYLSQFALRRDARRNMTGSAGQLRVPPRWLNEQQIPIAPLSEQRRIVAKIDELFSDLDAGVAALERARANLKRYRAAVLKAAVEGKLTERWRAEHPNVEPASKLLARIIAERRKKWESAQQAKYAAAGKPPPKNWKARYVEPTAPDTKNLSVLPIGWCWGTVEQLLVEPACNGISIKGSDSPPGVPALRLNSITPEGFDYTRHRYIRIHTDLATELEIHGGQMFVSRGNGTLRLLGRAVLADPPPMQIVFPDTMIRVILADVGGLRRFVKCMWDSRLLRRQIERRARTTAGIYKISQRDVAEFVVPIPPAAEQLEIVGTLDELLTRAGLAEKAVEHGLVRAARLRQSILKQAFEGKLVPQDPADEPASTLLGGLRTKAPRPAPSVRQAKRSRAKMRKR